jgi:archaellum biogenesis ATPase FlaH
VIIELEKTILRNILTNETYMRKVLPFIQKDYFEGVYKELFSQVVKFVAKYNRLPSMEAFKIELDDSPSVGQEMYTHAIDILPDIFAFKQEDPEWLLNTTEKWCQDRAVYKSIMESIQIIDGKHDTLSKNAIPDILQKALSVCFDTNVGHDYLENVEERYAFYHEQEDRIPFDLDYFNRITKGGLPNKTLNIALAGTGVGKSLFMCHVAANALSQGRNVLYITMEMAEERIAERIDANLMNVPIDQLDKMSEKMFKDRVSKIASSTNGKLIIKEYPTGSAHTGHFRALLTELKLKKRFKPEIIFIDYLNICSSSRMKGMGGAINSYSYIKAIAEELRGLAVEFDVPILSATQTTRSGFGNSDPGLEDTSESFGLPATADLMFALISNEELSAQGQILVKQLKNRYNDPNVDKRFVIGIDRSRMKLMDAPQEHTMALVQDTPPVFDNTSSGKRMMGEQQKSFSGFKMS